MCAYPHCRDDGSSQVTAEVLKHAANLKVVGRAGVGIDNIDVAECTKAGVMVMNTPGGNTVSTAQLAVTLLCAAARRISEADASMKAVRATEHLHASWNH